MVAKIEFKLQCPSCEAQVPVRDRKLIGRKIDCPKCKYRFVVKDPEEEEEANGKAPKGKKGKGKGDAEGKGKKKEASKRTLYMGLGLGLAAVVLLAIVAFLLFGPSGDPVNPKPPPRPGPGPGVVEGDKLNQPVPPVAAADVTNLLPNDVEEVASINVARVVEGGVLGKVILNAGGGFSREAFAHRWGFGVDDVKRLVSGSSANAGWSFNVVQMLKPVKLDDLKTRLALKPAKGSPTNGLDFFTLGVELDPLGRWLLGDSPDKPLLLHQVDDTTLVLAHAAPLEKFLQAKGRPALRNQPPGPAPAPQPAEPGKPEAEPAKPAPELAPAGSGSYLTIEPALKAMMDRLEDAKEGVVWNTASLPGKKSSVLEQVAGVIFQKSLPSMKQFKDVRILGFALEAVMPKKLPYVATIDCANEEAAKAGEKLLREKAAPELVKVLKDAWGLTAVVMDEQGNLPAGFEPPENTEELVSKIAITQKGPSLTLRLDLAPDQTALDALASRFQPLVVTAKGRMEMTSKHSRLHDLAAAVKAYADKHGQFPRGTQDRKPTPERGGLPWRPDQRLSWMVELLPFLGHGEYQNLLNRLERDRSWRDPENHLIAITLVPYFLTAGSPETAWWISYPGLEGQVAATHYVGIAGVGLDAADPEFATLDPNAEKKIGVFGYDRITKLEDIKDGLANTIVLVQVPLHYKTPWLAGGGSTVRGVPETGCVGPFVCAQHNGKSGTFAIMADGQVRFIPEDVPDDVFKALCTINGGEKIDNLDAIAPVVPSGNMKIEVKPMVPPEKPAGKP